MNRVQPESVGFSSQRLARINTVMQRYVDDEKLAGIVTLVARRGQVVHFEQVGMANIEIGQPMAADTIFRIYSMTKPITSVAVLMLFEEGHFQLTDPVADYLPMFRGVKVHDQSLTPPSLVEPVRPPTIHDLLTHTAGLSYGFDEHHYIDSLYRKLGEKRMTKADFTLMEWMEDLSALPLVYQPGTRFRYSMATDVLGALVQTVSEIPFADFLQQRIFAPLGMVDTAFTVPPDKLDRFAANYGPADGGGLKLIDPPQSSHFASPTQAPAGGGGLTSTTIDYLRFAQMLLNQGELDGVRLLGRKTVELMTTNHLPNALHPFDDPAVGFGLGVSVLLELGKARTLGSVGNYGWGGAANTNFWIDPVEQLLGVLMLQFMPSNTYPVTSDFRNLTYQALVD
jgi:CubicO group peptidase (beta-lactamase class C family)